MYKPYCKFKIFQMYHALGHASDKDFNPMAVPLNKNILVSKRTTNYTVTSQQQLGHPWI